MVTIAGTHKETMMRLLVRMPLTRSLGLLLLVAGLCLGALAMPVQAAISGAGRHDIVVLRTGKDPFTTLVAQPVANASSARPLPTGLLDRAGHMLYVATLQDGVHSVVRAVDAVSGRTLRSVTVEGNFLTQNGDYPPALLGGPPSGGTTWAPSVAVAGGPHSLPRALPASFAPDTTATLAVLSFNGRWLALRDAMPGQPDTQAIVINTATMRVAATIRLAGRYGLDAINGDGSRLYLLKILGPQAYEVRVYDTRQGRLEAQPLRENGEADTTLRGVSWTRAWSPRGDWLFTLYVQPGRQGAFIHALGVVLHAVHCIMLPDQGPAAAADLAHYTLAVAPDGSTLYAVNPVLGRMVVVRGGLPYGARTGITLARRAGSPAHMLTPAALSHDGRTMFVATDQGVWAVDTRALRVRATYLPGHRISSVALSRDGRRLYALQPDQDQVTALDVAGGRLLGSVTVDAAARGIERILTQD
jgi:DNA-binding beta-propeller fold protein YncE